MKWMNPVAKESLQNFLAGQPLFSNPPDNLQPGLQTGEVRSGHAELLVGMSDGAITHKCGEQRFSLIL
jgi:hypothetical protein